MMVQNHRKHKTDIHENPHGVLYMIQTFVSTFGVNKIFIGVLAHHSSSIYHISISCTKYTRYFKYSFIDDHPPNVQ